MLQDFTLLRQQELEALPPEVQAHYTQLLGALVRHNHQRKLFELFPDDDIKDPATGEIITHARWKYEKHLEFFRAGANYRERCFMAANRVGKTIAGAYEVSLHLTGLYPEWWEGRRFKDPVKVWAAGKTNKTTRDIIQEEALLGPVEWRNGRRGLAGTGMIPGHLIAQEQWNTGVPNMIDTIKVHHTSGGWSTLGLKSYEAGRGSFEGTSQHVIWLDEEPGLDVYGESLVRTMTTGGIVMLTFTPLLGMTPTVMAFQLSAERAQLGTM